ncbi:hypothetical protein D920_01942 [Enterococcus faecalis 13-SD-W-01]|nr:hypothetical protein D920_01942 [Enterococcus faecalis 13-SD-W-01]
MLCYDLESVNKKGEEMKKKVRWGVVGAAIVVVGGMAIFTINERNYGKQVEAVASELSASEKMLKEIEGEISALYAEGSTQFLDAEITQETIDAVQVRLTKYQETSLANYETVAKLRKNDQKNHQLDAKNLSTFQGEVKLVQEKFDSQQSVNALFQNPYLTGTDVKEDVVIVDDLSADKVADAKKAHFQDEVDEKNENQTFQVAINKGFEVAESQLKQIDKAKKAVSDLYKDEKVTDKATKETFDTAKKEVQAIKNEKARKSFDAALKAIEEKVKADEAAKEEAEKQAEEAKRQEEQAAANQETQVTTESTEKNETVPTAETTTQETDTTPSTNTPAVTQPVTPAPPASNGNSAGGSGSNPGNNAGGSSTGGNTSGGSNSGGNTGGSSGGGSTTTPPPTTPAPPPAPEKPYRVTPLGNSGMEFATIGEANNWGMEQMMNPEGQWFGRGYVTKPLLWSNNEVLSYSIDFR